jgi:hypothetical protein
MATSSERHDITAVDESAVMAMPWAAGQAGTSAVRVIVSDPKTNERVLRALKEAVA